MVVRKFLPLNGPRGRYSHACAARAEREKKGLERLNGRDGVESSFARMANGFGEGAWDCGREPGAAAQKKHER
eukprot:6183188-Pleurochrysis_carterae.AAC.2